MKTFIAVLFFTLVSSQAWAFDRLKCQGNLLDWTVYTNVDQNKAFMSKEIKGVYVDRKDSANFIIKNEKNVPMVSISPWNNVLYLKSKSATAGKYKFLFNTDDSTYFNIAMFDSNGSNEREFRCEFTF